MYKKVDYNDAVHNRIFNDNVSNRMIVMIPAHNEQYSIGNVLKSLTEQRLPKDILMSIFIALDNCTDDTEKIVQKYEDSLDIYTLETVENKERKAGALNQLYRLFFGDLDKEPISEEYKKVVNNIKAFVGIDADVYLAKETLSTLYDELTFKYKIGSVSAKYTCLLPESEKRVLRNNPNREFLIENGKYSGPFGRWLTTQQNREFSAWTISQLTAGKAEIAGGQCSMFSPEALQEIYNKFKLNGIYNNATDTEDLLLTQNIRELGWDCVTSPKARCYVDSMVTYASYVSQRMKWTQGTIDYMLQAGLSTWYSRRLWGKELMLLINFLIRVLLVILVPSALLLGMFKWNWIWATPILAASVLNVVNTVKTPNYRFIDLLLAVTNISPELYLLLTIWVHLKVWVGKLSPTKKDGWALQYQTEQGKSTFNFVPLIFFIVMVAFISTLLYNKVITVEMLLNVVKPYIVRGFAILTNVTIFMLVIMIYKMFKFRGGFKA